MVSCVLGRAFRGPALGERSRSALLDMESLIQLRDRRVRGSGLEGASACFAYEECVRVDCIVGLGPTPGISPNQVALGFTNGFGPSRAVHRESASKVRMLGRERYRGICVGFGSRAAVNARGRVGINTTSTAVSQMPLASAPARTSVR